MESVEKIILGKGTDEERTINDMSIPVITSKSKGVYTVKNVPEGVYIYTTTGFCILPDFYGLYKESVVPVGVAVICRKHSLLVALHGSNVGIAIFKNVPFCTPLKKYDSEGLALKDWEGKTNTSKLATIKSHVSQYCLDYESGNIGKGLWWLPSLSELNLMYKNKPLIDACLALCGGDVLLGDWHWTSTETSVGENWVIDWSRGYIGYVNKNAFNRVRPVSAFPKSVRKTKK